MFVNVKIAGMTDEEAALSAKLAGQLAGYKFRNSRQWKYYDGEIHLKNIGIALPDTMVDVEAVLGWPEIVVDALSERIDWLGWRTTDDTVDLSDVFIDNQLQVEVAKAIQDSLVTGVGFLAVSHGDTAAGEPLVIVDAVDSSSATYIWDERRNRMAAGFEQRADGEGNLYETLYLPNVTIASQVINGERFTTRHEHGFGRCMLVALPNRARAGSARGRSELTKPIRYLTDHGIRTILQMEYNREFYTTPQRYLLNVYPEQLDIDEDATREDMRRVGWQMAQNKALIVPPAEEDKTGNKPGNPSVGQFSAAPPTPYIDQLRALTQMVGAQAGVPATYFGFVTDNPPSADAIRAMESRLVKKAELRQISFGKILVNDLAYVCLAIAGMEPPTRQQIAAISCVWREASTPTMAATSDAVLKLASQNIVPTHSEVIWNRLGFNKAEQEVMRRELQVKQAADRLAGLARGASMVAPNIVKEWNQTAGDR